MNENFKYSFVIPVYNEELNIKVIYNKLLEIGKELQESYEIIFINDGSTDNSLEQIKMLSESDKRVKYIDLSRNFGHQIALTAGLQHATGKAVISMDCDMQDPPDLILEMITKWKKGNQIVYARRKNFREDNRIKKIGSKIYYSVLKRFAEVEIPRNVGDFRLVDEKVLKELNTMREKSRYLRGMVAWIGYRHEFVDYFRPDRSRGTSGYSLEKLIKLGMDGFFNFTFFPLKFGMYLGLISIFVGIGFLIYMFSDIILNNVYYHLYKFLVVILFIFMGFLFILFWLIGEYIARIYDEVRDRPLYVIREKGNFE